MMVSAPLDRQRRQVARASGAQQARGVQPGELAGLGLQVVLARALEELAHRGGLQLSAVAMEQVGDRRRGQFDAAHGVTHRSGPPGEEGGEAVADGHGSVEVERHKGASVNRIGQDVSRGGNPATQQ